MSEHTTVFCLTPVKDEAWILERFLACAGTWADHIIVADQGSTDGSAAIARSHPKVTLVENADEGYDEGARQRLLIEAARAVPVAGSRVLFALDADEFLSANWSTSTEWQRMMSAPPGTVLRLQWVNVAPGVERGWVPSDYIPFGFVDDGSEHTGSAIHSPRVPVPDGAPEVRAEELKVLHYQYTDWARMRSKQRWYQCWERLRHPEKRPVSLYRQYHHMDAAVLEASLLRPEWLEGYERSGIDMRTVRSASHYRWDEELIGLFAEHGVEPFRRLNIWDIDWAELSRRFGARHGTSLEDPRNGFERAVHGWLARTQRSAQRLPTRGVQWMLRLFGW
jgi:hypothetical protein